MAAEPQTRPFLYDCVTCGHADPWHSMWPTLGETERACKAQGCECRVMVYPACPDTRPGLDALRERVAAFVNGDLATERGYVHLTADTLTNRIVAFLAASPSTEAGGARMAADGDTLWLRCSSCNGAVPERDATVTCLECGEGMVFSANAAASPSHPTEGQPQG